MFANSGASFVAAGNLSPLIEQQLVHPGMDTWPVKVSSCTTALLSPGKAPGARSTVAELDIAS